MIKKYLDFTSERNCTTNTKKSSDSKVVPSPEKKEIETTPTAKETPNPKEDEKREPIVKEPKMEKFEFIGKVAKFPGNVKPSVSIILLENNKVSKEKLHYIISEQTKDTLVIVKYNENTEIKLTEFIKTLMEYYKKNEQLKQPFGKIIVEGTEQYSIIKNIPDVKFGDRRLIQVLNDDLVKLLK